MDRISHIIKRDRSRQHENSFVFTVLFQADQERYYYYMDLQEVQQMRMLGRYLEKHGYTSLAPHYKGHGVHRRAHCFESR